MQNKQMRDHIDFFTLFYYLLGHEIFGYPTLHVVVVLLDMVITFAICINGHKHIQVEFPHTSTELETKFYAHQNFLAFPLLYYILTYNI